jgi:hypothetical protein
MRIFTAQERLINAVMKVEEVLWEDLVQSAQRVAQKCQA